MSCNDDFSATRPRKQPCLPSSSSQRAGPSTRRTRHPRIFSSTSLPPYSSLSQTNSDHLLDPLDDIITLDSDLDQRTPLSTALLSQSISSSTSTDVLLGDATSSDAELPSLPLKSRQLYPLREPGQMTAQRTQRLRARTAAVIASLPATSEEVDEDEDETPKPAEAPPVAHGPKLRRVSGVRDLRRAFCDGGHGPVHFASDSSLGISKASYELGFLASSISPLPNLSLRSSSRTLVDFGGVRPQSSQSSSDLKTLCGSTFSSLSIASRLASKVHSTLPSLRPHARSPSDTSDTILSGKRLPPNTLTPRPHRHASLQLDTPPPQPPGEMVWSCAKISQSALKHGARRGYAPRRVFSNPIAILAS